MVTWRRARTVPLSTQGMPVAKITGSSWLNRIEARFTALRCFTLDGTDRAGHKERGSMIRRCVIWWNRHTADIRLRTVVTRVNVA